MGFRPEHRRIGSACRRLVERSGHVLRRLYYRLFYGEDVPGGRWLADVVEALERRLQPSDVPAPRRAWDREYASGRWSYMTDLEESPRYAVIAGFLRELTPDGHYLDVGCGEGTLFRHLGEGGGGSYLGIDVSSTALRRARQRFQEAGAGLALADAESFVVDRRFDAIVFNEVLYYLTEPLVAVRRYYDLLALGGVTIVSTYHGSPRAMAILDSLKACLPLGVESVTRCGGNAWSCSVFGDVRQNGAAGTGPELRAP